MRRERGFRGRFGAGECQARVGDRGGRRTRVPAGGPARGREDDARAPPAVHSSVAHGRRSARGHGDPFGRRSTAVVGRSRRPLGRFARRIIPFRRRGSSAAEAFRGPAKSASRTMACCFSTSCSSFRAAALEALRQPLEDGRVVIARAALSVEFPARFSLIAAMNPCPCSYLGHPTRPCVCAESEIIKYRSRLSGPLADRIDMQVTLTPVPLANLDANVTAESSTVIRSRVDAARALQRVRYAATRGVTCNAHASGRWLLTRGRLSADARRLLVEGSERLHLSARAYHRVLRVARTIADLDQSETVTGEHVGEALRYRQQ